MNEWNLAVARARGEIDIHLEQFLANLELAPPPYALAEGAVLSTRSIALTYT